MICYLCRSAIPEDQPFYNDYGHQVCKPCFEEAPRCFVCRFPGKQNEQVEGLGLECEFCRGNLIAEGAQVLPMIEPLFPFLSGYGLSAPQAPSFEWINRQELRDMQSDADLAQEEFIDDFLRYCYPVYYKGGVHYCLRRMSKPTFIVYAIVQLGVADIAARFGQENLAGKSPFHTFARGFCHWVGYEAAKRLDYDLESRQMRKWPELGAQGEFERWESMARFSKTPKIVGFFNANLQAMARKHLAAASSG
ncbi:MAG: hypothetical protein O7A69_07690 [SAR324 cluster bacterium]|nr:hypothetical protein [SAR324 cluster bacterium]